MQTPYEQLVLSKMSHL